MGGLKARERKGFSQGHEANLQHSWKGDPGLLTPGSVFFPIQQKGKQGAFREAL